MLDINLMHKFREAINDNNFFVLNQYKNKEGKNQWSIICSCADWIDVASDYLNNYESNNRKNIKIASIEVYSYISAVDLVCQAIDQLHRVFFGTKDTPYSKLKDVFDDQIFGYTDELYFKHLRAAFGAHPVNMSNMSLSKVNKKEQWYASWPTTGIYGEFDFSVRLYSLEPEKEDLILGIKINKINEYLQIRYNHLLKCIAEIERQYNSYIEEYKKIKIETNEDVLSQISILQFENEQRLSIDCIEYILDIIYRYFSTEFTRELNKNDIQAYSEEVMLVLVKIKSYLESMSFEDINLDIMSPRVPEEIRYNMSKISGAFLSDNYEPILDYHLEKVISYISSFISINMDMSLEEKYFLIKIA